MKRAPPPSDTAIEQALRDPRRPEQAPAYAIEQAIGLWRPHPARATAVHPLRQLLALLQFDSLDASPLAMGLRATEAARRLLYTAEAHDVDLRIQALDSGWEIRGQVLGPVENGSVALDAEAGTDPTIEVALDTQAEFRVTAVSAGRYRLRLRLDAVEIDMGLIAIGAMP